MYAPLAHHLCVEYDRKGGERERMGELEGVIGPWSENDDEFFVPEGHN